MKQSAHKSASDILEAAIPMFAREGYNGVSLRDIAKEVGLNAASLYHHFPDKETLYLEAMKHAFSGKAQILSEPLQSTCSPEDKLSSFILQVCEQMHASHELSALMQREILDGNKKRLRIVTKNVFNELISSLTDLCGSLSNKIDAHLLAISVIGMIVYHYQLTPIRLNLQGYKAKHDSPKVLARHITSLVLNSVKHESE